MYFNLGKRKAVQAKFDKFGDLATNVSRTHFLFCILEMKLVLAQTTVSIHNENQNIEIFVSTHLTSNHW